MAKFTEIVEKVFTLISSVEGLKDQTSRLDQKIYEHSECITKLEAREEVLIERTRNAAIESVTRVTHDIIKRLTEVEMKSLSMKHANSPELPPTSE